MFTPFAKGMRNAYPLFQKGCGMLTPLCKRGAGGIEYMNPASGMD